MQNFLLLLFTFGSAASALSDESPQRATAVKPFVHPGLLHSRDELTFVKQKISAGKEPWRTAWQQLQSSRTASPNYTPHPFSTVVRGPYNNPNIGSSELSSDSTAAYTHALQWSLTGNVAHATKAIEILNAWSSTLESVTGHDTKLLIGMTGVQLCNAAELLRYSDANWLDEDQQRFERMLKQVFYPEIKDFYPTANGNWDASMIQTMLAMGVFLDDREMFDRAVNYYLHGAGNGAVQHYINAFGECQESGRDQNHTQMGLGFLGRSCEMAWKQGVDLYGAYNNRLALGFEYTAQYNLGHDVRYEPYRSVDGRYDYPTISPESRGRFAPIYAQIVYHYHLRRGLEMPSSQQAAKKTRLRRRSGSHLPWDRLMFVSSRADRPNVVLIMCDDLGYGDPQTFNPDSPIQTPHIDALASDGLKFTRFYSAAPVCSPTRGSCLTGRHPYRYGIYGANQGHMKKAEITLPELLKRQGYTTGHFGKWHLGTLTTTVKDANRGGPRGKQHFAPPAQHGYDVSFVTESKVPTFDPMIQPRGADAGGNWDAITDKSDAVAYGTRYWDNDGNEVTDNLAGDDSRVIMDRAVPFIEKAARDQQPFFAAIWFHAPHLPCVADTDHASLYPDRDVAHRNYYGCVTAMDEQLGRLRAKLQQLDLADNTMLWFCSDNGPEGKDAESPGSAGDFRGRKRSLYEGGVRVPAILVWPGHTSPGTSTDFPAVTSDYLPTVLNALHLPYPDQRPIDGVSLIGAIDDPCAKRTEGIGFQSHSQIAWHQGQYKLISSNRGKTWELYDLTSDPAEKQDLAASEPQPMAAMTAAVTAWQRSVQASDSGIDYKVE